MNVDLDDVKAGKFDFVDFGCSNGQSIEFGMKRLGATTGIGIDRDEAKVKTALEAGYKALHCDIRDVGQLPSCCSFVTAFHFLEHLPGYRVSQMAIHSAMNAARDYVFIKVPWFESDGWLFNNGLKFFWSD